MPSRAELRVQEYLRALGLMDTTRLSELSTQIAAQTNAGEDDERAARQAVRLAQESYERWRAEVFCDLPAEPDALWLRAFLSARPEALLAPAGAARRAAQQFGDAVAGRPPVRAPFREQRLDKAKIPLWARGLLPPAIVTALATVLLAVGLSENQLTLIELFWLGLFAFLIFLVAVGAWTAVLGFRRTGPGPVLPRDEGPLARTALIMPIYHEDPEEVFAALAAMRESLLAEPGAESFEIFVLSDSRDPEIASEEERVFRRVATAAADRVPVFYRRRSRNERNKAGNIAEFLERWGRRYSYVIVLDADSVMSGATLVELVTRIQAAPRVALLQAPIALAGGKTLLARLLEFATSVYGPTFARGLSRWSGPHGNYYGHNAVLRVRAFLESCALPELAGEPPLGGHILSHDFVEAALLCRAGWEVRFADDLGGSFEGIPPTLPEYIARDRRWCQGNLQHLRVVTAYGLKAMSRVHLILGACAYLAGPVWLIYTVIGVWLLRDRSEMVEGIVLLNLMAAVVLLLGPRVLGLIETLRETARCNSHGGRLRVAAGVVAELILSTALAPLMMLHHTAIVYSVVAGDTIRWGAQRRGAPGSFVEVVRAQWLATSLGFLLMGLTYWGAPHLLPWLAPVWAPWMLSIPLAYAVSSRTLGSWTRRLGLLLVPTEVNRSELLTRAAALRQITRRNELESFRDLILDPVLVSQHVSRIQQTTPTEPREKLAGLCERALWQGPESLNEEERHMLLGDAECVRRLHREGWQRWPVERWRSALERPQLPPEPR